MIYWYSFLLVVFVASLIAAYKFFTDGNMGHTSGLGNGFLGILSIVVAAGAGGLALITFLISLFFG